MRKLIAAILLFGGWLCPATVSANPMPRASLSVTCEDSGIAHFTLSCSVMDQAKAFQNFKLTSSAGHCFPRVSARTVSIQDRDDKSQTRIWAVTQSDDGCEIAFYTDEPKPCGNGAYVFDLAFSEIRTLTPDTFQFQYESNMTNARGNWSMVEYPSVDASGKLPQVRMSFGGNQSGSQYMTLREPWKFLVVTEPSFAGLPYVVYASDIKVGVQPKGRLNVTQLVPEPTPPTSDDEKIVARSFCYFSGTINKEGHTDLAPCIDPAPFRERFSRAGGVGFSLQLVITRPSGEVVAKSRLLQRVVFSDRPFSAK